MDVERSGARTVALLEFDPDLAGGLSGPERDRARTHAVARTVELAAEGWEVSRFARAADDGWLGLFVLDGLLIRKVTVGKRSACELLGPGDLFRPWDLDGSYEPLPVTGETLILRAARLAVLDREFTLRIGPWPEITARLFGRLTARARHLGVMHAVGQLRRIDTRLLILFWLLAERWGTVGVEGVRVTLPLTHEMLAMLVGAHRPTVTLALARLAGAGLLTRERADRWLLSNAAIEALNTPETIEVLSNSLLGDSVQEPVT
jgi:CRP/FNR family transcriptional regulator, cyclic AMP receptor protein